jgi:hypothetical protein
MQGDIECLKETKSSLHLVWYIRFVSCEIRHTRSRMYSIIHKKGQTKCYSDDIYGYFMSFY